MAIYTAKLLTVSINSGPFEIFGQQCLCAWLHHQLSYDCEKKRFIAGSYKWAHD